ncbi:NAD(P)-binding protein, partial [Aureobasidium melanogenum]
MSDNNNSAEQKQGGGLFGSLSNAAGGLASGVGGVASGTVNTVGGVVGNVGRGVGKTLSDASSGLENTTKGAGSSINDMTGAKSQPQKKSVDGVCLARSSECDPGRDPTNCCNPPRCELPTLTLQHPTGFNAMTTALIFGPTGAVGSQILATLLSSPTCTSLTTISRRAPQTQTQVSKPKTIIEADTAKWGPMISTLSPAPSVVFNAVGTTMASAGSIAAQRAIDHDLCIENAKAAKEAGVKTYVYCSSAGTSGSLSPFALTPYAKMKRGVENAIKELNFENAIILRPGMILGREIPKNKWLEDIFDGFKKISQSFQDKWAQDQTTIGRAAVAAVKLVEEGKAPEKFWVLEQSDIVRLGRDEWKE